MRAKYYRNFVFMVLCLMFSFSLVLAKEESESSPREFKAVGPREPVKMGRGEIALVLWLKAESDKTMRFTIERKD
jgi:hypothetical protein